MPNNVVRIAGITLEKIAAGVEQSKIGFPVVTPLRPGHYVVDVRRTLFEPR